MVERRIACRVALHAAAATAMNGSDYARLAASCDRLLRAPTSDRARLAIGFLHLIHEHPSWLAQYERLFAGGARPLRERSPILETRDLYRMMRGLCKAMASRPGPARPAPADPAVDVLIVSRLVSDTQLADSEDFYFGAMAELLRARGARVLLAYVDHRGGTQTGQLVAAHPGRVLLPRSLPPRAEFTLWQQCASARASLAREALAAQGGFDRLVAQAAAEQSLSASTAANLRLYSEVWELCRRSRPRILVTTFEGDASERMIFLAARRSGAAPLCVGYQHTRLLPRAHAARRAIGLPALPCDPDVLLTLGAVTQPMLQSAGHAGPACLVYGSHRRAAASALPAPGVRSPTCLVLPDAEPGEHALMFDFTLACARRLPGISFVFRPHPLRKWVPEGLPQNLRVDGDEALHLQAAKARVCLYRASSAVLHAALAGARPLYLARPGEMPFDPLTAMPRGRTWVSSADDLAAVARESAWSGSDEAAQVWKYCDRYVAGLRPAALDELLRVYQEPTERTAAPRISSKLPCATILPCSSS
jgi:hypothetical protein